MKIRSLFAGLLLAAALPGVDAQAASLAPYQGRYFRTAAPAGWQVHETMNGVEVKAPDQVSGAVFTLLLGAAGQATPRQYLQWSLANGPYTSPKIHSVTDLPDQPGVMQFMWKVIEAEVSFGYQGVPVRARVVVGVIQGYGQYSAALRAYQAPQRRWDELAPLLAEIDAAMVITNPTQVAGAPQMYLPKGIRHDEIYGSYNKGYAERQQRHDAWAQKQDEGNRGYARMKDPETGRIYDMTPDRYDPTIGGYRNPQRPTDVLVPAAPGE